jgi:hypothetical protein
MKFKTVIAIIGIVFSSNILFSQTGSTINEKTLEEKLVGTYIIIQETDKFTGLLTNDVLIEVEKRRHDTDDVYIQVNSLVSIRILPRSIINAVDFDPKKYQ